MGCHLNDLIDSVKKGSDYYDDRIIDTDSVNKHVGQMLQFANDAICFDLGEITSKVGFNILNELAYLPFDNVWIEFYSETANNRSGACGVVGLLSKNTDKGIYTQVWGKLNGKWKYNGWFLNNLPQNDEKLFVKQHEISSPAEMQMASAALRSILCAINCTNVQRVENKPSEKLQKARIKRGKQPLFSYWTLHVDLDRDPTQATSQGGTHAPPRLHLRRGHARQYAPGKYCWVRACAVGNGKLGMVHKDYAVNA